MVEPPKTVVTAVDTAIPAWYVGNYELAPTFSIAITWEGDKLYGQATGQGGFERFAESTGKFYLKVVDAQVTFVANDKGSVNQLILHQNGRDMPGKRLSLTL